MKVGYFERGDTVRVNVPLSSFDGEVGIISRVEHDYYLVDLVYRMEDTEVEFEEDELDLITMQTRCGHCGSIY